MTSIDIATLEFGQEREQWFNAYCHKDISTLDPLETKDFFVVYYQNVEKKSDWHSNILSSDVEQDVLAMIHTAKKILVDCRNETCYMITSYFKIGEHSVIVKEMWSKNKANWQMSSLALTKL